MVPALDKAVFDLVAQVPDPEIPVLNLLDLGILREVVSEGEILRVKLTPTYSGCPATEAIAKEVRETLAAAGYANAQVDISLSPAWSSDWISEEGRRKLKDYGIAPPACLSPSAQLAPSGLQSIGLRRNTINCPRCDATQTEQLSNFGSTPCKAMYRCLACREPFDYFKPY